MRSFIAPRPKELISHGTRLFSIVFGTALVLLLGAYGFFALSSQLDQEAIATNQQTSLELASTTNELQAQLAALQSLVQVSEEVHTSNNILKESIKNLFDLVPDRIVLSRAAFEDTTLVMEGVTPNKEVYAFKLEAPLRSIFQRTETEFTEIENGWYRFVVTCYAMPEVRQ